MRFHRLTQNEAQTAVRALVSNFYDATPRALYSAADFQDLAEQLAWILHGKVSIHDIDVVYEAFDDLLKIELGVHPRIRRNGALTVDNTHEVRCMVERNLTEGVYFLLQGAGFIARPDTQAVAA